jgi:hypothetical protein
MKSDDLISFIIEEVHHRVISDKRGKNAESALVANAKRGGKHQHGKQKRFEKHCKHHCDDAYGNCGKPGHMSAECWSKGGGKEGQGPRQRKPKKVASAVIAVDDEDDKLFCFTCTSDYVNVANSMPVLKSKKTGCVGSGASSDYSLDRSKFTNYRSIDRDITTADGQTVKAIGMGVMHLELPNGPGRKKTTFKNAIHSPDMAFTLISISRLEKAGCLVTFHNGMCTIK